MDFFDIIIIGAGVNGLAVAAAVSSPARSVLILEKNASWGQETSSRNSEVIHAGIYYQAGSLKAAACVEGRRLLYDLCRERGIGHRRIGKLIVAVEPRETAALQELKDKAFRNDVALDLLTAGEVRMLEPEVACVAGLYSPETGIVDSHRLMEFYLSEARGNHADLVCQAQVVGLHREANGYRIMVDNQGERLEVGGAVVINCAGLHADKVAALAGLDTGQAGYEQYFLKGSYFRLSDKYRGRTSRLIYPVPDKNSLGVHTVLDLNGGVRLGPDEEEVPGIDYQVDPAKGRAFYESARKFLPMIAEEDLTPDMSGIRAQLRRPNRGNFRDFIVSHEKDKGFPGLINCIGIESPGLTASRYLGRLVAGLVREALI